MTDTGRPRGVAGPPWSVELLADLHAGALDEAEAAALWPRVRADSAAMEIIDALDATTSDLAGLRDAPAEPMPADVAARIEAALAEAAQAAPGPVAARGAAPVVDLAAARRRELRRNRRLGWSAAILATAAAAVAVVAVAIPDPTTGGTPLAGEDTAPTRTFPAPEGVPQLGGEPNAAWLNDGLGVREYGPLEDEAGLRECLAAHGLGDRAPVGFQPARVNGADAMLIVLTTGELARFRVVAVEATCSKDDPGKLLADRTVGKGGN